MNKFKFNRKLLIVIISICLVILISIIIVFMFKGEKKSKKTNSNYNINSEVKELPGTKVYDDEKISKKHCVDNICVENAVLYYSSDYNSGRVEYTVVNNSDKTSSGKLQMVFKDTTIDIIYKDLEAGKSIDTRTQFMNKKISNVEDYELKKIK